MRFRSPQRLALAALAAAFLVLPKAAAAQAPVPGEMPWNAPVGAVRARLARLGFTPTSTPPSADSTLVFEAQRAGVRAVLRARFRNRVLWHAFYTAEGDSAALQRELDRTAAALTARHGAPAMEDASRVWTFAGGRRFALPKSPARLEDGRFGYAVAMQRQ